MILHVKPAGYCKDAEASGARKEHAVAAVQQLIWKLIQTTPLAEKKYNTNLYFKHLQANASQFARIQNFKSICMRVHVLQVKYQTTVRSQQRLPNCCKTLTKQL